MKDHAKHALLSAVGCHLNAQIQGRFRQQLTIFNDPYFAMLLQDEQAVAVTGFRQGDCWEEIARWYKSPENNRWAVNS